MKILMCIFEIQDLGGIINHAEHLIYGLKKLGHDVDLVRVENKSKLVNSSCSRDQVTDTFSGLPLDQKGGWHFPIENRVAIQSTNWKKYTKQYDLVLWEIPVPPKQDTSLFSKLYNISTPQISFIHDGNAAKMYPHIKKIAKKMEYFACVHPCAMGNMEAIGIDNIKLIVNPQVLWPGRMKIPNWESRGKIISSFQTFKAWKHVDDLVRAIPFMTSVEETILGGGGIEYYYMTSKDKCKPKYKGIWGKALRHGMNYVGYKSEQERDKILAQSKLLIDTSWSHTYSKYGSHFNRAMIDGIIQGCLPVLRDLAMVKNGFFKAEKHYIEIPYDVTPESFATYVNEAINLSPDKADRKIRAAQAIIKKKFDAVKVAEELLCI